jgi:transcriptional regulator with XRE-family HTH domain
LEVKEMEKTVASIAERLRAAMDKAGKKQADLVRETGLDRGSISSYLSGKYEPKQKAIYKLSKALDVSEAWLLGFDVPMYRTDEQKKNDHLAEMVVKMRTNEKFYDLSVKLAALSDEQLDLIDKLVSGLTK